MEAFLKKKKKSSRFVQALYKLYYYFFLYITPPKKQYRECVKLHHTGPLEYRGQPEFCVNNGWLYFVRATTEL